MPTINTFDFTNLTNGTGNVAVNFFQYTSENTNFLPGMLLLLAIVIIVVMALILRGLDFMEAFSSGVFVGLVVSLIMFPLGIIAGWLLVFFIVMLPICAFMLIVLR